MSALDKGDGSGVGSSSSSLLNQPIVMDVGTDTTKAGFAGGSKPKVVIGTKVGRAKHTRIMPGGALEASVDEVEASSGGTTAASSSGAIAGGTAGRPTSVFVGSKLEDHRGAFIVDYPMDKGCVVDGCWNHMETIWNHIYSKQNLNANPSEHPILLTEPPHNPKSNRSTTSEIFFETYRAPALFFSPPAVLSLYASGRTTGVVLDVGEGTTHVIPVYEGYALKHSIGRSDIAGRDVNSELQLLLRKNSGLVFTTTAERDLVKKMKEDICFVSLKSSLQSGIGGIGEAGGAASASTPKGGTSATTGSSSGPSSLAKDDSEKVTYQLPDGQAVSISSERHMAPEVLFNPSLIGSEEQSVANTLVSSIMKSDMDLRPTLFTQIVLAGGTTCMPGFGDRLLSEVRSRAPAHTRIRISAPPERIYSAWAGGSILASLATFKNMWVTRADYEEYGDSLMHRAAL
mmetsp:Transcript_3599/g.5229  ORF Transcript_3599/g.5229 Transcript_3599/m.5229 type:complete len:458 (-) Transcript_3599:143-1516(-)|eukprot:CAMPEP_0203639044 /NCGR_PEP_ID=MMETSP0088-20131115/4899_1 /ASSEMBLY_ACC=CAM_ASM_001087 /TAXON_ID=426623 /ORGANISM="Chaetoceros affinis, Strain CCMP159" /LENGTH=457 /DNA_ID=CAMNT_0050493829 /DNA_START=150 /DNA_END=1523 /DNA_ORIENTATION=-